MNTPELPEMLAQLTPDERTEAAESVRRVLDAVPPSVEPADRLDDARARYAAETSAERLNP